MVPLSPTNARDRVKEIAYASIANAKYHGEKKHFSFDTCVNIHQDQDFRHIREYTTS
jgi:hypothetical protein